MPGGHVGSIAIEDTAADEARWCGVDGCWSAIRATGASSGPTWSSTDGRIAAIEPDAAVGDAQVIDADGALVLPGFVDTHRHTWQTAMRGICADWTLLDYFRGIRLQISTAFGAEDVYAGNFVGALEALDCGVTTLLDFSHCLQLPRPRRRGGARAARGGRARHLGLRDVPRAAASEPASPTPEDRLADARRMRERHFSAAGGLLDMGVALTELGLVPFDATRAEVALARELDVMVTAHIGSVDERAAARPRSSCCTPPGCSTTARCTCTATPARTASSTCSPTRRRRSR